MSSFVRWVIGGRGDDDKKEQPKKEEEKKPDQTLSADEIRQRRLRALAEKSKVQTSPTTPTKKDDDKMEIDTKKPEVIVTSPDKKTIPIKQNIKSSSPMNIKRPKTTGEKLDVDDAMMIDPSPPVHDDDIVKMKKIGQKKFLPFPLFVHDKVSRVFHVSLVKKKEDTYFFLEDFSKQISGHHFTEAMVEPALVERLSHPFKHPQTILNYLVGCYKRASNEIAKENRRKEKPEDFQKRVSKLEEFKRIAVSYFGLVLLHEDMFPQTPKTKSTEQLLSMLEADHDYNSENELPEDFLRDLIIRYKGEELEKIFNPIFTELAMKLKKSTLLDSYLPPLRIMARLTSKVELSSVLIKHSHWLSPVKNGISMEQQSVLGPFFGLTTYYDKPVVADHYFLQHVATLTNKDVYDIQTALRLRLKQIHDILHKIMLNLLRPKETREAALQWLAHVIEGNKYRARMRDDLYQSATEGFMSNLCSVMLKLCEPFSLKLGKLAPIDPKFSMTSKSVNEIVDWTQDTKLATTEKEATEWFSNNKPTKDFSFVTRCFFYTHRAIFLGVLKTFERYRRVLTSLADTQRAYDRAKLVNSPDLAQLRDQTDRLFVIKWAAEAQLLDPNLLESILAFYRFTAKWLIQVADPTNKGYPLEKPAPMEFAILPEYVMDSISDFLLNVSRFAPSILSTANLQEIFDMVVYFIANEHYVKNPYVRAKFPEVYAAFTPYERFNVPRSVLDSLVLHKLSQKHLMAGLMKLYVDIEHTGSSTQFYDKFTPRYFTALVLKYVWNYEEYRKAFIQHAKSSGFLRFFNMLLNDAIYLLDESLKILMEIKQYQTDVANKEAWNKIPIQTRREREYNIATLERQVQSYMLLARESVHMLSYLSKDCPDPFLRPEMIDRVASMLNYFLVQLAGPKCQNLKVENREKYHFDPKYLLTEITDSYIHFSKFSDFIDAVARDTRSYQPAVFERTAAILRKIKKRSEDYIQQFESFSLKTMEAAEKLLSMEQEYGDDVPQEFLDPITYLIMENPVKLPSNVVIDRATIERHLLNDNTDPFNRQYLTKEMLVDDNELKEKIQKWKAERQKNQTKS